MARKEKKQRNKGSAGNNRKTGEDFLRQNATKKGVLETGSGLQYFMVEEKQGKKPQLPDEVIIHQRALLLDGKVLEDTYRKNKPERVKLNEMIEGLQEGLQMMTEGSRYQFWVPPDLGWGKKGTSNKIPPFAVLFFDIRLLEIT
ncbi:MAG TPA: FKBP-type peptidyl-prolyl cis-trans isomerase [Prolixibacteraceae bacterium]|nr:FKBP-type peptidyl-prolyl cis-trans isomerase [Prolixibacteraceae bacterium]